MKKIADKTRGTIAKIALSVTKMNANSNCIWHIHQPKLPEKAKKLRKF